VSIRVKIHKIHRRFTDDREEVAVMGHIVGDCLKDLIRQFPALEGGLFDKKGELLNNIEIYVNQESAYPDELAKAVSDGDVIHITLMIDGG
jgi:molybdopterin converting factor small subunit